MGYEFVVFVIIVFIITCVAATKWI